MKKLKRISAALLALCMAVSFAGCDEKERDKDEDKEKGEETTASVTEPVTTTAQTETTTVTTTAHVSSQTVTTPGPDKPKPEEPAKKGSLSWALQDKKIGEITLLVQEGTDVDKWVEIYEDQGGAVNIETAKPTDYYNTLAAKIISGTGVDLAYGYFRPIGVKQEIYTPMDGYADLESVRWQSVKDAAENFRIGGDLYALPIVTASAYYVCYNIDEIENSGYDDPYELWLDGRWDFETMALIMEDYVSNGYGKAGMSGSVTDAFFGANAVGLFTNKGGNLSFSGGSCSDAMNAVAQLGSKVVTADWYGNAKDAFFDSRCLFYIMGEWAFSGPYTPKADDHWGIVPVPSLGGIEATACKDMVLMAINYSQNPESIPAFLECAREPQVNQKYIDEREEKFAAENPFWTEQMFDVKQTVESSRYRKVYDFAYQVMTDEGYFEMGTWFVNFDSWESFLDSYKEEFDKAMY